MRVVLAVGKKSRHGETRFGEAYEIAIGTALRWHHIAYCQQLSSRRITDDVLYCVISSNV